MSSAYPLDILAKVARCLFGVMRVNTLSPRIVHIRCFPICTEDPSIMLRQSGSSGNCLGGYEI